MSILNLNGPAGQPSKNKRGMKIWMGIGLVIAVLGVGSTLASTITINQGNSTEFGQGVQRTVYCGGNQTITLVPISGFINTPEPSATPSSDSRRHEPSTSPSPAGTFYLSGIRVTNIPKSCSGKDFVFSAYDKSGSNTPVQISVFDGVSLITPTVYWQQDREYGGLISVDRNAFIDASAAGLATLENIEQDGDNGGFIINFLDGAGVSHAPIDSIARIVVETQDDTFGLDEHVNHHRALSQARQ
jgi:hypothetical protein